MAPVRRGAHELFMGRRAFSPGTPPVTSAAGDLTCFSNATQRVGLHLRPACSTSAGSSPAQLSSCSYPASHSGCRCVPLAKVCQLPAAQPVGLSRPQKWGEGLPLTQCRNPEKRMSLALPLRTLITWPQGLPLLLMHPPIRIFSGKYSWVYRKVYPQG